MLQTFGGIFTEVPTRDTGPEEPHFVFRNVQMGAVGLTWQANTNRRVGSVTIQAGGGGLDADMALIPALAEGLERYAAGTYSNDQFIVATGNELAHEALDLAAIPRCSARELAHPKCPLFMPDKNKPIRWVKALSLLSGQVIYVPAVLAFAHLDIMPSERFWLPISTGCAAHVSYQDALLAAIYEVIERDAISLTWLQQLRHPEIEIDIQPASLRPFFERYQSASEDIQFRYFDATSDLGIPTVYGIQIARYNDHVRTLVSCSTTSSITSAIAKVMVDMAGLRQSFSRSRAVPENWDDFTGIMHGATYMADHARAEAYRFLLETPSKVELSLLTKKNTSETPLASILDTLRQHGLDVYAVDLSTDEAIRCGMRVVRAIIPGLQPLSFRYRARYLGHPRLYEAPLRMGFPVRDEEDLNPFPQPFA